MALDRFKNLPSHIIGYDWRDPSPVFNPSQIAYIESIASFLSPAEHAKAREIEWFVLNQITGNVGCGEIPGLRGDATIWGTRTGKVYVRRFSTLRFAKMMDEFLDFVPPDFPESEILKCTMPSYKVTPPGDGPFYPFKFHGELALWRDRLQQAAVAFKTVLGHFEQGKFIISDGRRIDFSDAHIESVENRNSFPKHW